MWLTILAVLIATVFFLRPPKFSRWNAAFPYLISLFSLWAGLVLSPIAVSFRVLQAAGGFILIFLALVLSADFFLDGFARARDGVKNSFLSRYQPAPPLPDFLMEICRAIELMTPRKMGALIIVERKQHLDAFIKGGMAFDAEVKAEILLALFSTASPVHDGAAILTGGRIRKIKAVLPLATKSDLPMGVGTRHRAAVGITEKTDAVALIVSEERGEISCAYRGILVKARSQKELIALIKSALKGKPFDSAHVSGPNKIKMVMPAPTVGSHPQ